MDGDIQEIPPLKKSLFERFWGIVKKIWAIRFIRFLVVGGINTLFGYFVYTVFILLKVHYSLALLLGTIIGIIFNFITTGNIVFRNKNPRLIFRFFLVYGITYLLNLGFLRVFNELKMDMVLAGAIPLLPMAIISYFLNRALVFRGKEKTSIY